MNEQTWQQAVRSLLSFFGLSAPDLPESGDREEIEKLLRGSDWSARPLRGGAAAFGIGIDAALLSREDGRWLAAVLHEGQAYLLDEKGRRGRVLTMQDMESVRDGFVFHRKEITKDHILSFYRRHRKQVLQILACGLFVNIFGLSLPVFSSFVYDKVLGNEIHETLWALAIGLFIVTALDFFIRSLRVMIAERFAINSETDIDGNVFRSLLASKTQNLPSIGRFLDRYKRLLSSRDLLSSTYLLSLVDLPFLILFALAIVYAAGFLVLVPLLFGALMLLGNLVTAVPLYDYDRQSRSAEEKKFGILTDFLASHEAVTGSYLGREMAARWREACAQTSSLQSLSRYWKNMGANLSGSLTFLSYVFVIIGGAYMVDSQTLSSGGLLAASMLSSRMMASFSSIVTIVIRYKDFKSALKEMDAILPAPPSTSAAPEPRSLSGRVTFDNVTCRFGEKANPVLSAINIRIDHGEIVGIAGIPGSGKTTLMRLISGAAMAETGEVLIDHYPVRLLRGEELAATVGYKPQDLCLVEGTIEDNVRAGGERLTTEQRDRVLTASGLGWVFQQGGIGWTTEVGPRGSFLSGGQRQLVALARAFLNDRPLLLLDEPTNGLDVHLESHLMKQLAARRHHATVLVTTHSRELLSVCDKIIVVGNSRILAEGPRDKVLVA